MLCLGVVMWGQGGQEAHDGGWGQKGSLGTVTEVVRGQGTGGGSGQGLGLLHARPRGSSSAGPSSWASLDFWLGQGPLIPATGSPPQITVCCPLGPSTWAAVVSGSVSP